MKLLKASFLLAAAATQTNAADYRATWDLGSGRTATAIVGVSEANGFNANTSNHYFNGDTNSWLTRLNFTVRDSSNVEVMNRTITDVRYFFGFRMEALSPPPGLIRDLEPPAMSSLFVRFRTTTGQTPVEN